MTAREHTATGYLLVAAVLVLLGGGCSPEAELSGTKLPNTLPNTMLTAEHPTTLETGFIMHFFWDGYDPDGEIVAYQWRLSDNDSDGISVQDTLTVDPATGDSLNPWHLTYATDTTLVVSADLPGFPEDADLDPLDQRSFQAHTFFVRALDDQGGIDATPAMLSFTATTVLPRVQVNRPPDMSDYLDAQGMPPTVTFGFVCRDPDLPGGSPTRYRYLFKPAWLNDHYVRTGYEFNQVADELLSFDDPAWSDWRPYPENAADRLVTFANVPSHRPDGEMVIYLFALQAEDVAGARSIERTYSRNVQNFYISGLMNPVLEMQELQLGRRSSSGLNGNCTFEIAPGQELFFNWIATADYYAGEITAYRYGWDVADPDDELDPNWTVTPGNTPQHQHTGTMAFSESTHTLTIQVWDNSGNHSRYVWNLAVVPVPEVTVRRPVLLVDDVQDKESQGWRAVDRVTPLDRDPYRDFYWDTTLNGAGGVLGFSPATDVIDTEERDLQFRDLAGYRMLIWSSRYAVGNRTWNAFKPSGTGQPYNWLQCYQQQVGDLFLVGERVLSQFIGERHWLLPWIFDTEEYYTYLPGVWVRFYTGFGYAIRLDGSTVHNGRNSYPYLALGIAALDHATPRYRPYFPNGPSGIGNAGRSTHCVGVKAAILDPDFKANHLPAGTVFPDTIFVDAAFDWMDRDPAYRHLLEPWYMGGNDEMYDINVTDRETPWRAQQCDGEPCVEPMFRQYSRFDWIDDLHLAAGDESWPASVPISGGLSGKCGRYALRPDVLRTVNSGAVMGFVSHKLAPLKPSRISDVVWGFDPYRFENEPTQHAVQWLLGEHFGLVMKP
ncbi:MAG: hypothetical protein ABIF77_15220 [bacterium]